MARSKCYTGPLGCKWRQPAFGGLHPFGREEEMTTVWEMIWVILMVCLSFYVVIWMLLWAAASNSWDYIHYFMFPILGHFSWWMLLLVLSVLTSFYALFLLVLFLLHSCFGRKIYMHFIHKFVVLIGIVCCIVVTLLINKEWPDGWVLTYLFLTHHWVIIHPLLLVLMIPVGFVLAVTFFQSVRKAIVSCWIIIYLVLLILLFISPLWLTSPCVIEDQDLPPKPLLIAHRGGAALGPENTLYTFEQSVKYEGVMGVEGDLQISYDGVPFLFHDHNARRLTDVDDIFPDKAYDDVSSFNMSELLLLNAGNWFLQQDPYGIVSYLSEEERGNISEQVMPTVREIFQLVKDSNTSFLYDIKSSMHPEGNSSHPYYQDATQMFVNLAHEVGINPRKIIWRYYDSGLNGTEDFVTASQDLLTVEEMKLYNIEVLNAGFRDTNYNLFREYQENNISINIFVVNSPWLFSTYWCAGINSTTTNEIQTLSHLSYPDLIVTPTLHLALWIFFDILTGLLVVIFFICLGYKSSTSQVADLHVRDDEFVWDEDMGSRPQRRPKGARKRDMDENYVHHSQRPLRIV